MFGHFQTVESFTRCEKLKESEARHILDLESLILFLKSFQGCANFFEGYAVLQAKVRKILIGVGEKSVRVRNCFNIGNHCQN